MKRFKNITTLLLLVALFAGCSKKPTSNSFTHPRDAYTVSIPDGWDTVQEDMQLFNVLTILPDSSKPEEGQPRIVVLSNDARQPVSFKSVARDAGMKTTILRRSSQMFAVLDSSKIEVAGREGIVYTYERIPNNAAANSDPRHVVMVFLQANQGMISIKYIAPKSVAQDYAALFQENLNLFRIRDLGQAISEEEFEQQRRERLQRGEKIEKLQKPRRN